VHPYGVLVVDQRLRRGDAPVAGKPCPEGKLRVFKVRIDRLVERSDVVQHRTRDEKSAPGDRRDLLLRLVTTERFPKTSAAGQEAKVHVVPDRVDDLRVVEQADSGRHEHTVVVPLTRVNQRPDEAGVDAGVRIEDDQVPSRGVPEAEIVRRRVAQPRLRSNHAHPGIRGRQSARCSVG
jgi:hypothetical protein